MADNQPSCAVCRFMRSLAFSAIGGGVAGYAALALGLSKNNAIVAAFFGALGLVVLTSRKKQ
ncbi:hypothetical protein [Sedimenticola selenatireducens]|jgi:hypothetical protein|uniref:Uncharacterized protein n=1 Tax=Sedimenticola selenatireducens TaxID=191960 RepID=A0A557SJM6_9GAMM|nr:hypothetical protein [Sedimenticola selenatireducens]TVO77635.1 hypothetical protein FHP88_02210 [Sedimenticola selenatireducens]TVT64941.1 MAG: hypothetical protein FHK78_04575 [Sedimenticola selenatireducens]